MKKRFILTIALCALVGFLSAQSLRFGLNGTYFENNEVIVCDEAPNVDDWMTEMVQEMTVYNLTDNALNVMIRKEEVKIVEGTDNSFCWGTCFAPTVFVSPNPKEVAAHGCSAEGELSFHYNLDPDGISFTPTGIDVTLWPAGTTIMKYYAYPENNPDDKVCIEVWFAYNATSVTDQHVSFGKAFPNPASTSVQFDFLSNSDAVVDAVLYDLLGQEVMHRTVSGLQNKVDFDVNNLQPGIYFCSFSVNGELVKTEKFIVKR